MYGNSATNLQFFDLAFLIVLELKHVLFKLLALILGCRLFRFGGFHGKLELPNAFLGCFYIGSDLGENRQRCHFPDKHIVW